MDLSPAARAWFQGQGRLGGRERAKRMSPAARRAGGRSAAIRRWTTARFGGPRFAALGLPAGAWVDKGLDDLAAGLETCESLLVSASAPRLAREGVPLPAVRFSDAETRLYRLLERTEGDLAHARWLARLRAIASFADACSVARRDGEPSPKEEALERGEASRGEPPETS